MGESNGGNGRRTEVLVVVAPDPDADPAVTERLGRQLQREIRDLDVEHVRMASSASTPEGTKGVDGATLGTLLVALSASGGVLTTLIGTLHHWLGRQRAGQRIMVTIDGDTIELQAASAEERFALIDAYVRRHSGGRDDG
ncbi:hypothetical protein GCM10009827_118910 [Dactylosporangium maewongense]|uniref:Uncharacterized protein n=1 Tax=Dactylosporangium maewongense TaxID=634393 RepID=A0ABP4PD98_9ACTN